MSYTKSHTHDSFKRKKLILQNFSQVYGTKPVDQCKQKAYAPLHSQIDTLADEQLHCYKCLVSKGARNSRIRSRDSTVGVLIRQVLNNYHFTVAKKDFANAFGLCFVHAFTSIQLEEPNGGQWKIDMEVKTQYCKLFKNGQQYMIGTPEPLKQRARLLFKNGPVYSQWTSA
jgi:hypothetical protein